MNVLACAKCENPITNCSAHSHDNWEIILHLTGSVISTIKDTQYNISPGDVMIIPPGIEHDGKSDVFYTDIFLQAEHLDFSDILVVHDIDSGIHKLFMLLHKVMTEKDDNYSKIADSLLETICHYIKRNSKTNYKYPFVQKLKNEIYKNLSNSNFSIYDEITKLGFNIDYFRRCFKEDTKRTPNRYITELRINQAQTLLLQDTFISIDNISKQCGFNDSFYFSTCFKKHVGISPLQYRKKNV